jgi:anhydro-N-acetylmuramic acid kinase
MKKDIQIHTALGIMSGTSLDGLDLAICRFKFSTGVWNYEFLGTKTVAYSDVILNKLKSVFNGTALNLVQIDTLLGKFIGEESALFIESSGMKVDLIASHGHTIFHSPVGGYSTQIGNGAHIAAATGIQTVTDFRSVDIAHGGQGAPLVPIGDELLFGKYAACLNMGGFANISYRSTDGKRIAFDICPVNFVLNRLVQRVSLEFDKDGEVAASGKVIESLLKELNENEYFAKPAPKSLGQEWVDGNVISLLSRENSVNDLLGTYVEHISDQIVKKLEVISGDTVLFTGGGVKNKFLMERIECKTSKQLVIPDIALIDMKEALIFALLGVLRVKQVPNAIASATGAAKDSVNGVVYLP